MSNHGPHKPIYTIGVAADLCGTSPRLLRLYDREGLVTPFKGKNNRRLYSDKDLEKIRRIYYLNREEGVNLQGVKVVLELEALSESVFEKRRER